MHKVGLAPCFVFCWFYHFRNEAVTIKIPKDLSLKYKTYRNQLRVPFSLYCDTEAVLTETKKEDCDSYVEDTEDPNLQLGRYLLLSFHPDLLIFEITNYKTNKFKI